MPLTPVGKIFKPALVRDAIRRVCEQELAVLDEVAESIDVSVDADKVHGSLAIIKLRPVSSANPDDIILKSNEILGRFTFKYTVEIE
jgi:fatty-acyl-CoA synthase